MNGAQTSNSILEIGKGNNDMKRIAFGTALALALLVPVVSGQGVAQQQKAAQGEKKQAKQVKDPVCGMMVDPTTAEKAVHNGKTYYFCTRSEKESFEKSPEKYVKPEQKK